MPGTRFVEIRALSLKPGSRAAFHRLFSERSLPLLRKWDFDVVSFGPSPHDETSYYVIRSFTDLADRQKREDDFYGSGDWKQGPREAMLALVESYTDVVLELEEPAIAGLRQRPS